MEIGILLGLGAACTVLMLANAKSASYGSNEAKTVMCFAFTGWCIALGGLLGGLAA